MLFTPEIVTVESWEIRSGQASPFRVASHVPSPAHEWAGLLRFAFEQIIERPVTIHKATLVLTVMRPAGQTGEVSVGTILTPWSSDQIGWESPWAVAGMKRDADYEPLRTVPAVTPADGSFVQVAIDATEDLRRWFSGRLPNHGWRVTSTLQVGAARNPILEAQPVVVVKYSDSGAAYEASAGGL